MRAAPVSRLAATSQSLLQRSRRPLAQSRSSHSPAIPRRRLASTKIQALKWSLPIDFAKNISIFWARTHFCEGSRWRLFLSMLFPRWMNTPSFEVQHIAPFYIPAFFVDAILRAKVLQGPQSFDIPISVEDGYFSATESVPLSSLQLTSPDGIDPADCVPFDSIKHSRLPSSASSQHETSSVTVLPFQKSPLGLLALRKRGGNIRQDASTVAPDTEPTVMDLSKSSIKFFTAYPVYIPMYLSKIRCIHADHSEQNLTVALVGHSTGSTPLKWASRAFIYDQSEWRGYASSRSGDAGMTVIRSTFASQPVQGPGYEALLSETSWSDQVDLSICRVQDNSWEASPAVMDYKTCSERNKEYLDRLWQVEEAKATIKSLDYMDEDVKAIKLDMYNRKISKLAKEDIQQDLQERIKNLESEAREVRPAWFEQSRVK